MEEKNKKLSDTLTKLYLRMDELDEENDKKDAELELFRKDYEVAMAKIEEFFKLKKIAEEKFLQDKSIIQELEGKVNEKQSQNESLSEALEKMRAEKAEASK